MEPRSLDRGYGKYCRGRAQRTEYFNGAAISRSRIQLPRNYSIVKDLRHYLRAPMGTRSQSCKSSMKAFSRRLQIIRLGLASNPVSFGMTLALGEYGCGHHSCGNLAFQETPFIQDDVAAEVVCAHGPITHQVIQRRGRCHNAAQCPLAPGPRLPL